MAGRKSPRTTGEAAHRGSGPRHGRSHSRPVFQRTGGRRGRMSSGPPRLRTCLGHTCVDGGSEQDGAAAAVSTQSPPPVRNPNAPRTATPELESPRRTRTRRAVRHPRAPCDGRPALPHKRLTPPRHRSRPPARSEPQRWSHWIQADGREKKHSRRRSRRQGNLRKRGCSEGGDLVQGKELRCTQQPLL
ncbi:hypothetical protein BRADI_3g46476v3 [Brachypodium distachyon]|uniref:Uncharacterized protein n=1 Tax=Brachypodium distachyon TaxID=15368 RepID=A0A2K2D3M0_BRADI|nr:hypothetical protein BRADI_3g46476v3 [Brachypodium distachyon]PNT68871.1 hypothetical protein BRADI_3g46476v3 [Brachypodium distachyon]